MCWCCLEANYASRDKRRRRGCIARLKHLVIRRPWPVVSGRPALLLTGSRRLKLLRTAHPLEVAGNYVSIGGRSRGRDSAAPRDWAAVACEGACGVRVNCCAHLRWPPSPAAPRLPRRLCARRDGAGDAARHAARKAREEVLPIQVQPSLQVVRRDPAHAPHRSRRGPSARVRKADAERYGDRASRNTLLVHHWYVNMTFVARFIPT